MTADPVSLELEVTVSRWPALGEPTVISGPASHPLPVPGPGLYADQPYGQSSSQRVRIELRDVVPAHPGWFAALLALSDDYGRYLITPRPIVFYGHRSEFGTHIYCPQTQWGDASYSVGLRVASGGL